jgi:hypothetical protein
MVREEVDVETDCRVVERAVTVEVQVVVGKEPWSVI